MKTTVQISDALLGEVQAIARKNNTTLRALVQEGLQHVVATQSQKKSFKLRDASFGAGKTNPLLQNLVWEDIAGTAYEGRSG